MPLPIRAIEKHEIPAYQDAMAGPFGFDPTDAITERFGRRFEIERLRAAIDQEQIVGTIGTLSLHLTVPGGALPTAGTTVVTVASTHRRQGLLTQMMTEHLREAHQQGEAVAALWASESSIYGRFGYGPAAETFHAEIKRPHAQLHSPLDIAGSMRLVDKDQALADFAGVYERVAARRPGMFRRSAAWWKNRRLDDPADQRGGCTAHRRVLHQRGGVPAGYAIYRTQTDHPQDGDLVHVSEVIAVDPVAEQALWQYLFGIDLIDKIKYWNLPVDSPLHWWLKDPRKLERKITETIWIRPVDIARALAARRYAVPGDLVFEFRDEYCPWNCGRYRLHVDKDGHADCQASTADADLQLDAFTVGAAYLGGNRLRTLANAGLVKGTEHAVRTADAMFAWEQAAWCQEIF